MSRPLTSSTKGIYNPSLLEFTKYSPRRGAPQLLDAISTKLSFHHHNLSSDKHLMVSAGVKSLLYYMLNSIIRQKPFDERDIVIYFSPTWGLYHSQTILAGGLPVDAPLSIDSSNKMDVDLTALNDLIVTYGASRIRAIIVCSPNNPSSTEVPLSDIELIAEMILTFHLDNCYLVVDEIYSDLTFDQVAAVEKRTSLMHLFSSNVLSDRLVLLNGFSKLHSLCGLRLGYAISNNTTLIDKMLIYSDNVASCAPTLTQVIVADCINTKSFAHWQTLVVDTAKTRATTFYKILSNRLWGFITTKTIQVLEPVGGFYSFLRVNLAEGRSSAFWVQKLLVEYNVASVPGDAFRPESQPNDFAEIRFSLGMVSSEEELRCGAERVCQCLEKYLD
eukprot:GHVH01007105.1.p1 GENE.GHVH01007105.1~~GHVH01007105.1.p1  ORF type:complete len:389 (-),score=47.00 GHVH01007105.1:58-1224(-)